MSSEDAGEEAQFPTALQIFVLNHLTCEESKQAENDLHSIIPYSRISIWVRKLIALLPSSSMPPEKPTTKEVYNQLNALVEHGLLEYEGGGFNNLEMESFSVTGDGMLYIKQYLAKLSREIKDKKVTERDIDRAEGDSGAKKYLKGLLSKLVDKSQDEIADTLFSAIRTQGLPLASLLINLSR
jgi:hypothetical protein